MICLLNPFRNASKLADAQTELAFLNNADISEPSTTTDICKGSWNGIVVAGAVDGACPEPDRAAGKLQTGEERWAPPWRKRIVLYIGKVE